jgi:signal transduction histidine kinase
MNKMKSSSNSKTYDHLYRISKITTQVIDWRGALNEATKLVRSILIFDNMAVYLADKLNNEFEVVFARAMGRGKKAEADSAWGENLATQIIEENRIISEEPQSVDSEDRLEHPYLLGIPLTINNQCLGALLLIRFGGPPFENSNIKLAEFIAQQLSQLVERERLYQIVEQIEDQHKQMQLQKDFISTISHELRSPLGFIKGYTTTLLRADTSWDSETQREFLQIIDQETDHLKELIENLLDSSLLQSGLMEMKFQHVRIDTIVKDVIARNLLHYPDLKTSIKTEGKISPIIGDPHRLAQVMENLITNSIKYAPRSEISVTIKQDELQTNIVVRDNGPGIPEEYQKMIFERFFRIPGQSTDIHGSGLGLFICKQIIEAHNGQISSESGNDEGAAISIILSK